MSWTPATTPPHGGVTTPLEDGFYLPADSCRLARVWLAWPEREALQDATADLAGAVAEFAAVSVVAAPALEAGARRVLGSAADVAVLPMRSARLRDTGPTFLVDGKGGAAAVDWLFNGWGGRGANAEDRDFAHALLGLAEVRRFRAPLTLEPSVFVGDGQHTLLALAPAVFDPARNPRLTRLEAFAIFQQWLGVERVIWLEQAHPRDALVTEIRALAAFIAPGRVAVSAAPPDHALAPVLAGTAQTLAKVRDGAGNHLDLTLLPVPSLAGDSAASYTGFLAVNGGVLVPAFGGPTDAAARAALAEAFPDKTVRLVPAATLALAGLSLTSIAMPHPARLLERDRASVLPRSAWAKPVPDVEAILQKYSDLAAADE